MTPSKTVILFVDDEPEVLSGLRNLLRKRRRVWDMRFALGPEAALEVLERTEVDVVVSDVRMPSMDGVTLLENVRRIRPRAARLILSGECNEQTSLRAAKVAHRFLSKPCDPAHLSAAIEDAVTLQRRIQDPSIREVLGGLDRLPPAPTVYVELCERAGADDVSVDELASIIERDPSLAAKVLQLVNSSYFGLARSVGSIKTAVHYLGADTVRDLAVVAQVFDGGRRVRCAIDANELATHATCTAAIARALDLPGKHADHAATAALLHDVGLLALATAAPKALDDPRLAARGPGAACIEAERQAWGTDHAAIGAFLLGLWGLPAPIVQAVAMHHRPSEAAMTPTTVAVHVADALADCGDDEDPTASGRLDVEALAEAGVLGQLDDWIETARRIRGGPRKAA